MVRRGCLKRHTRSAVRQRLLQWSIASIYIWRRVKKGRKNFRPALLLAIQKVLYIYQDYKRLNKEYEEIRSIDFGSNYREMSVYRCLELFRIEKDDIARVANAVGWPDEGKSTSFMRQRVSKLKATCILLWRFATTSTWREARLIFGHLECELSDMFWEVLLNFVSLRGHLIYDALNKDFMQARARLYSNSIQQKSPYLNRCVGFVDGTVIKVAKPLNNSIQKSVYNGHKRAHALKFQVVLLPDGLAIHTGSMHEGRRHDITLWRRSNLDVQLESILDIDGEQYSIFGDSAYVRKPWLEIPDSGAFLTPYQEHVNASKSKARVTAEWYFMEMKKYWARCDYKRSLRILQAPYGKFILGAVLLTNIRNCLYPNEISQFFGCNPPSLEEYLDHKSN